jgi:hypothetical protein
LISLLTSIAIAAALVAVAAAALWLGTRTWMSLGESTEMRQRALEQFRAYRATNHPQSASIEGATSRIIAERESGTFQAGRVVSFSFTLLAQSSWNDYFLFVYNENGSPYVKLLTQDEAARMQSTMNAPKGDA